MQTKTLTAAYVRKLAASYRYFRSGGTLPRRELTTLALAASGCLRAHAQQQLVLANDVRLPLDAVVRMLQAVQADASSQLRAVKSAEGAVPVAYQPAPRTPFFKRVAERLAAMFGRKQAVRA